MPAGISIISFFPSRSGYSFSKLVSAFYRNLVTNSDLPLKMIRDLGICSLVVSFVLIVVYLARYFSHGISIAGWTTTIVLLLFFGGMTLFSIGVLGRYLISIMLEAKKYPSWEAVWVSLPSPCTLQSSSASSAWRQSSGSVLPEPSLTT